MTNLRAHARRRAMWVYLIHRAGIREAQRHIANGYIK